MQEFLLEYGLLAVFLCAIVENDVTFILTGVIVHLSTMHPVPAIVAGLAGALLHDSLWFGLGHWRSETVRSHRVYRRVGPAVERLAARFGPWELFVCRFIYGTRTPSLVFWGVQRLSVTTFLLIEILALTLWGTVLVALGYFLSNGAAIIIGKVKSMERWMLSALIIAAVGFFLARVFTRYELRKRLQSSAAKSPSQE
jgi:membrane protein DedA with SNARE-associated domain